MRMEKRDHGGGLDAAVEQHGGTRADWIDLSTGINPDPYPVPQIEADAWTALPDLTALEALTTAARAFWQVPDGADVLAVPGASALIAQIPRLMPPARVYIPGPTYNEHAASFAAQGWHVQDTPDGADATVAVHPNNPDGRTWLTQQLTGTLKIIDESFCDVTPDKTHAAQASEPGTIILKSFGKFWGLAGLRLGFAIAHPDTTAKLAQMLGPWAVSGPALRIGAAALSDPEWATTTRTRLAADAVRLDDLILQSDATLIGGTSLFRLYDMPEAQRIQTHLAQHQIWSRTFPYNPRWLRLGLPPAQGWDRLAQALS